LDLDDIQSREQANELFRRGLERGTTRVFTVYSELGVSQLPELASLRKSLADYSISVDELHDPKFYRVNVAYGSDSEIMLLDSRLEDVWELAYQSSQQIQQSLAIRFFAKLYPYVAQVHLKSSYLTRLIDFLDQRYGERPILERVVAKQFFDIKKGETIIRKKTLVLYQEDCEPTLRTLQKNFTVWPSLIQMRVFRSGKTAYLATFGRNGVSKFIGGDFSLFREDTFDFITKEAQRQRSEFAHRAPSLSDPESKLKPIIMQSEAPLSALLPSLRDGLMQAYQCATIHDMNPYLDMRVVDARSGSVFQVIASGSTLAVVPITYKTPTSLIKLTSTVSDLVGVEPPA
jgi:hypothetical protein